MHSPTLYNNLADLPKMILDISEWYSYYTAWDCLYLTLHMLDPVLIFLDKVMIIARVLINYQVFNLYEKDI